MEENAPGALKFAIGVALGAPHGLHRRLEGMRSPASQPLLKAALWDMDGTIVDTERYWIEAEHALVAAHGGQWSHEKAMQLVGQSLVYSAGILQEAGVALEVREIIDTLTGHVVSLVRESVPWRPGARELLEELHTAGVRCALVTMSEAPLAREIVASLPKPYFEFLVTGDTVTQGKPHPEAYLKAVELLQQHDPELDHRHCVALEDSGPGVAAAVASGVVTVAIPHIVPLPHDPRRATWDTLAGRTVADLEELLGLRHEFTGAGLRLSAGELENSGLESAASGGRRLD